LPPRGQAIRVLCCELSRISSHLLGVGVGAMDTGAMTVFLYTFTEREKIYNLCELLTGARFTTSYTRVGGHLRDLPDGFRAALNTFLDDCASGDRRGFPPARRTRSSATGCAMWA
jgi:NADH-quinone oxidoreductase subunit D